MRNSKLGDRRGVLTLYSYSPSMTAPSPGRRAGRLAWIRPLCGWGRAACATTAAWGACLKERWCCRQLEVGGAKSTSTVSGVARHSLCAWQIGEDGRFRKLSSCLCSTAVLACAHDDRSSDVRVERGKRACWARCAGSQAHKLLPAVDAHPPATLQAYPASTLPPEERPRYRLTWATYSAPSSRYVFPSHRPAGFTPGLPHYFSSLLFV